MKYITCVTLVALACLGCQTDRQAKANPTTNTTKLAPSKDTTTQHTTQKQYTHTYQVDKYDAQKQCWTRMKITEQHSQPPSDACIDMLMFSANGDGDLFRHNGCMPKAHTKVTGEDAVKKVGGPTGDKPMCS